MKTANVVVRLNTLGSNVLKKGVTPAEVLLLVAEHGINAGGSVVESLEETEEVERSDSDELRRLMRVYGLRKVKALFPGATPRFPEDFDEARKLGLENPVKSESGWILESGGKLSDK